MKKVFKKFGEYIANKNIAFGSLLILLAMLLVQTGISLFVKTQSADGIEQLDIIFRTALSSIFGFIISIVAGGKPKIEKKQVIVELEQKDAQDEKKSASKNIMVNIQIVVITGICIYCLLAIITVRNFPHLVAATSSSSSTISLYRDFISGGIGALIGLSKSS